MDANITKGTRRCPTWMPHSEPSWWCSPHKMGGSGSLLRGTVCWGLACTFYFLYTRDGYQVCIWHKSRTSILILKIPSFECWHFRGKGQLLHFYLSHLVITLSWAFQLLQNRDTLGHFQVKDDFEKCRAFKVRVEVKCVWGSKPGLNDGR